MRLGSLVAAAIYFAVLPVAQSQDGSGCDTFKWSLSRELGWFKSPMKPVVSGDLLPALNQAYEISLKPVADVAFTLPPERPPKQGSFGAVLTVVAIDKPGLYEISLSDEGWIDAVQNGERVKTADFTGLKTCPGLHKSMRFALTGAPLTIQISNVEKDKVKLAIATVE